MSTTFARSGIRTLAREEAGAEPRPWHALDAAEVVAALGSDPASGLSSGEARRRLERFGPNALRPSERGSWLLVVLHQFKSPLIFLLLLAAGGALALGHVTDAAVICAVLALNATIGALQEGRAEKALRALRKLSTQKARAVRDGREVVLEASELVPGDVLLLEAGDAVPADARVLTGVAVRTMEAALTGESVPVEKQVLPVRVDSLLPERSSLVYAGTFMAAGRARCVVVATGTAAEVGRIAALAEAAKEPKTPLEVRIAQFGRAIVVAAGVLLFLVLLAGEIRKIPLFEILMIGISQVVSMIPVGLPVAMTVALAVGVQRMSRRRAVVRRLVAVETLGSTTVICTDKTGTLTKNEMTATELFLAPARRIEVSGSGYDPIGAFREAGREIDPERDGALRELLEAAVLCNDAQLERGADARWIPIGDPTEVALVCLGMKGALQPTEVRARCPRRAEIPFDPAAKMMATQHDAPNGPRAVLKGAPEQVLELCTVGDSPSSGTGPVIDAAERMAGAALRVLAIAAVDRGEIDPRAGFASFRGRARFLGLVGQLDPPRPEVEDAVARCRAAGIKPVMVTGDHKATGLAVAKALGIAREGDGVVDGQELEPLPDAELARRIDRISVFARVHPAQKLRIVSAFQRRGDVVAMTGDGVNDAPALAQADVGVAMGRTGTEVAKEASKIVIQDDNFATIVAAVEEGRLVHRNLKKLVLYLFTTSMAEVLVLMTALFLGYPPPLTAVQILWINLVTDGMLTVTLIMEPAEGDEMRQRPIPRREAILSRTMLSRVALMVPAMAVSTLGWFAYRLAAGVPFLQVRTETFTVLAACQWFNVLSCRSARRSAFSMSPLKNPWLLGGLVAGNLLQCAVVYLRPLGAVFRTTPIPIHEFLAIGAVASLVLWVEEARKLLAHHRARASDARGARLA
jgi:Ca2+-transporting ATPase